MAITPPEFFLNYKRAWHTENTRPQPVIVEAQYAWSDQYQPLTRPLSGFTHTKTHDSTRAFRLSWSHDKCVVLHSKGSPVGSEWCGVNGTPGADGFVLLESLPSSPPRPRIVQIGQKILDWNRK